MTVQGFISSQERPKRDIMTILRSWILDLGPHTQERISYKVPFFNFYGNLCYLSPKEEGVELSFVKGYEIEDEHGLLESRGRKQIRSRIFYSVAELEEFEDHVRRLLNQAAILNEFQFKRKKQQRKKR
jgi:hypothetical protein